MNRSKKLCLLLGVLAAACIATFVVMRLEERKEQIKNSEEIILELSRDSVQSLSWEYDGETLAFHRDEVWLYDGDEAFPVSEERINQLLEQFEAFGVSFRIENVEDFGQYGLDDPICTIDLTTQERAYQILLGDYSQMDAKRYVSIGDGNVYLVQNDPLEQFDAVLSDMIAHDEAPAFDHVTRIQFTGGEVYTVVYEENSANTYYAGDVYFAQQGGKSLPLDTSSVNSYLNAISYLSPKNYVSYNAAAEDLPAYGLDDPDLTVTIDYTAEDEAGNQEEKTFVLHISRDPEEKKAAEEAAGHDKESAGDETVTAYARIGESQIIYKISSSSYQSLMAASYDDLRHHEVLWADFGDVWQMDISLEGSSYTITSEQDKDSRTYYYQGEELEIEDLQDALGALYADRFTSEEPSQKEEISLTVYLENENYPEVSIALYRYDGTHCLAAVDGQSVSLVSRSAVVDLMEAVHAIVLNGGG